MNERIRQLAEQAGIYKLNLSDETEYWIMEKFAEMIVKECLDIVDDEGCGEGGSVRAIKSIQDRFGVEE